MKNLKDKAVRQELILRYLAAETSVEEELMLADFYQQTPNENLSEEEEQVRQLVLATSRLADDFTLSAEKEEEFDHIMTAAARKPKRIALWPWLAAACLAGIMVIFLTPPKTEDNQVLAEHPTIQAQKPSEEMQPQTKQTEKVLPQPTLAAVSTIRETRDLAETEYDQSDLMTVESMFGVESRPDPMAEYMALAENLQQECDQVFQNLEE
jgi:hypothetical protein